MVKKGVFLILIVFFSFFSFSLIYALPTVTIEIPEPGVTIIQNQTTVGATDTNATTACADNEFLRGDGTCQTSTGDTNETVRMQNITTYDCPGTEKAIGFQDNGTIICSADLNTGASNIFDQELNTTENVTFANVTSTSWFNGLFNWTTLTNWLSFDGGILSFNETKNNNSISTIANLSDSNETNRFQNLTTYDCQSGFVVNGTYLNGTVSCIADADSGASNVFDQTLNTTYNVTFANVTSTSWFNGLFNWTINTVSSIYLQFNGNELTFNESQLNATISSLATGSGNETVRLQNLTTYQCASGQLVIGVETNGTVTCAVDGNTTIANETVRMQNLTTYTCQGTDKVTGVFDNGTITCGAVSSTATNIFDQQLNTTDNVSFGNVSLVNGGWFNGKFNWTTLTKWLSFDGGVLSFNQTLNNDTISIIANLSDTDSNETVRLQNLTTYDCQTGFLVNGTYLNGTVSCIADQVGTGNLSFNQTTVENAFQGYFDSNISDEEFLSSTELNNTYRNLSSTINENNISDLTHTGNETNRFQNLTTYDCQTGFVVNGTYLNGTVSCIADLNTGASNVFDQTLNTTYNVTFANVTSTSWFNGLFNWTTLTNWLSFDGGILSFNETKNNNSISTIANLSDSNETVRMQNLTTYACQGTDRVISVALNGTVTCGATGSAATSWNFASNLIHNATLDVRVGIGIATPSYSLEVNGNVSLNKTLFVNTNGLVGIGTSTPISLLHVLGPASGSPIGLNVSLGGTNPIAVFENTQVSTFADGVKIKVDAAASAANSDGLLIVEEGTATRFLVDADGNVGVGTPTPTHTLTVDGNINMTNGCFTGDSGGQVCFPSV